MSLTCVAIRFRTHGTLPWTYPDHGRTTLFYKCPPLFPSPRPILVSSDSRCAPADNANGSAWSADFFDLSEFVDYEDMTEDRMAMLEGPNARYPNRPGAPEDVANAEAAAAGKPSGKASL